MCDHVIYSLSLSFMQMTFSHICFIYYIIAEVTKWQYTIPVEGSNKSCCLLHIDFFIYTHTGQGHSTLPSHLFTWH